MDIRDTSRAGHRLRVPRRQQMTTTGGLRASITQVSAGSRRPEVARRFTTSGRRQEVVGPISMTAPRRASDEPCVDAVRARVPV